MVTERADALQPLIEAKPVEDREENGQIARAQSGDEAAIDWLLARYRHRVVRLAAHILRRPGDAEDAAQEAFVRAFRSLHTFRGKGRFLYLALPDRGARLPGHAPARAVDRRGADGYDYRGDSSRCRTRRGRQPPPCGGFADRISPPIRATLVLRELEGLEYEEIARVMQIPVGRVKWRLHTARAEFQKLLAEVMKETDNV